MTHVTISDLGDCRICARLHDLSEIVEHNSPSGKNATRMARRGLVEQKKSFQPVTPFFWKMLLSIIPPNRKESEQSTSVPVSESIALQRERVERKRLAALEWYEVAKQTLSY